MGHFDDVLAMEPGDEWDAAHLDELEAAELPPVVAALRLPGAVVELRGEVPPELHDELAPLCDDRLLSDTEQVLPLVVERTDTGWALDGPTGRHEVRGGRDGDLRSALLSELDSMTVASDPGRLHLAVSCVVVGRTGVVVVADQPEDRIAVTAELLRGGARLVTDRILTLVPGSHTVIGYPAPTDVPSAAGGAAGVSPCAVVDVVAFVQGVGGAGEPVVTPVSTAEACIRLLGTAIDGERLGPAVLDVVAAIAANAIHRDVLHAGAAAAAEAIRGIGAPRHRAFSVVHRFDRRDGTRPTIDRLTDSLRVARFDDGAVARDGATGRLLELDEDEIDALEELLVTTSARRAPVGSADPRLGRLGRLGMYVPDAAGRRPVPGPAAFGLPNCPSGVTASSMWADLAARDAELVSGPDGTGSDGTAALAVLRGALPGDDDHRRAAMEVHRRLQDEVVGVERQLVDAVAHLERAGIDPVVLGSVVNAHDGPLPPYFAESEQVDLLVRDGQLGAAVAALEAAGMHRSEASPTGPAPDGGPAPHDDAVARGVVDLVGDGPGDIVVRVRDTLAAGPFAALVDHDEFHRRSIPVRIHGRWYRSLHPEHRFVHACVRLELDSQDSPTQLERDVVLSAPRADALMAEAMEASERWGATSTVTAAVRRVDEILPGLPPWIVERSSRDESSGRDRRAARSRRSRRR